MNLSDSKNATEAVDNTNWLPLNHSFYSCPLSSLEQQRSYSQLCVQFEDMDQDKAMSMYSSTWYALFYSDPMRMPIP